MYLTTGNSDDTITVGSTSNTLDNVPKVVLASLSGGFNLLTVNDYGYNGGGTYRLWENHLSAPGLSDRIFFPASPENSPLLQVNLNTGGGNDVVQLKGVNNRLSLLPYFGLNSGLGDDQLVLADANSALENHLYGFTQFAAIDGSRTRAYYHGS